MAKIIVIAKTIKETIKSIFKTSSVVRDGFSIFHPCHHIEINKDVKDIATQSPFSYFDILPLYEKLNKSKEKTLKYVEYCASQGFPLGYVPVWFV